MRDYYDVLGIPQDASIEKVKARYRFLSQAYHPDKFNSREHKEQGEQEFKIINAAYRVLGNPAQRKAYDARLRNFKQKDKEKTEANPSGSPKTPPRRGAQKEEAWTYAQWLRQRLKAFAMIGILSAPFFLFEECSKKLAGHPPTPTTQKDTLAPQVPNKPFGHTSQPLIAVINSQQYAILHEDFSWVSPFQLFRTPTGKPELDWGLDDPTIGRIKADQTVNLASEGREVLLYRNGRWRYANENPYE